MAVAKSWCRCSASEQVVLHLQQVRCCIALMMKQAATQLGGPESELLTQVDSSIDHMALALRKPPFGANFAKMSFLLEIDPVPMYYHVAKYFVEILFIR